MSDEDQNQPGGPSGDEFRRMMEQFLREGGIDPSQLAGAAGLPANPRMMAEMMQNLMSSMQRPGAGEGAVNWQLAKQHADQVAGQSNEAITPETQRRYDDMYRVAQQWLGEATEFEQGEAMPRALTRLQWVDETQGVWREITEPVAESVSAALFSSLGEQLPEEMSGMLQGADQLIRNLGGTLFAMQLGQTVGKLASEVVSAGEIGVPLIPDSPGALLPQNVAAFGDGLEIPPHEIELYLAVRELAHAALFRRAKWLRLHLISQITLYAKGIRIDTDALREVAEGIDPSNPAELEAALRDGRLIPPRTEQQEAAHARLETLLALVEGWVDSVTHEATKRLAKRDALAEMVRRRRAAGGPAEQAFSTLVGLNLRPRRMREAAAMWQRVADELGAAGRDALWSVADSMPTGADIDDPDALIARARAGEPEPDELDDEIAKLLAGEVPEASVDQPDDERIAPEGEDATGKHDGEPSGPDGPAASGDDPDDPRPV